MDLWFAIPNILLYHFKNEVDIKYLSDKVITFFKFINKILLGIFIFIQTSFQFMFKIVFKHNFLFFNTSLNLVCIKKN